MGYQPRHKIVKDENGDLLADSHNILNRWKNYFSQLLNWSQSSWGWNCYCKVEKVHIARSDQIPAELIQGGEILLKVIHKLINSVWDEEELIYQWKSALLYRFTKRAIKLTEHATHLYPQKLAVTLPTSGGHSVGTVRSWTQATELVS
jgi:hypothetical protein